MNKKTSILVLTILYLLSSAAFAGRSDVGTSGAVFLKIAPGARPAAMGEAFSAIGDDVNSIFYNPAGTAGLNGPEFTAQYGSWFQGISYNVLGAVYPAGRLGSFGLGIINLGVSGMEKRAADTADPDGTFESADFAYIINYSREVRQDLSAGINAKIISQKIDNAASSSYAGDAGILWKTPFDNLSCGVAVQNFGSQVKFSSGEDPLPLIIKAAASYERQINNSSFLKAGLETGLPRDNDQYFSAGGEYSRQIMEELSASARAGYKTVSQEKLGGLSGLSAGAGIVWKEFGFDFAWVPYGELGDTFRYALVVKF